MTDPADRPGVDFKTSPLNYFQYFTEVEARFQQRRGSILMLSTLDWALIETWREAGVPLEAVLRGIDDAFDKHDAQKARAGSRRVRKINGLAWAAASVLAATEAAVDAATGAPSVRAPSQVESGFEPARVAAYLRANAAYLQVNASAFDRAGELAEVAARLRELAVELEASAVPRGLEALDRTLTALEERLFALVLVHAPEAEVVGLREEAARELAPYRGKMKAGQLREIETQFLRKRLLASRGLPRLSLFYMPHEDA